MKARKYYFKVKHFHLLHSQHKKEIKLAKLKKIIELLFMFYFPSLFLFFPSQFLGRNVVYIDLQPRSWSMIQEKDN